MPYHYLDPFIHLVYNNLCACLLADPDKADTSAERIKELAEVRPRVFSILHLFWSPPLVVADHSHSL